MFGLQPHISSFYLGISGESKHTNRHWLWSCDQKLKLIPGLFSLRSPSSFACFLPLLSLGACPDFHTGASSAPALVWLSNQAARLLSPPCASRIQSLPERSAGECPAQRTADTHTRSLLPPPLPPPPALKPDSSARETPPTLSCYCRCQSPVCILHQPAAHKIDQRSSPVGLTVRAVVCAGGGFNAFPSTSNHDTSAFELLFGCFRYTMTSYTRHYPPTHWCLCQMRFNLL